MRDYRQLEVWQKAHKLTIETYRVTAQFPKAEQFGLTSQIRRSSSSIPTNIAEGTGRWSQAEFAQFLHVAIGSSNELEYQLLLSRDLGYLAPTEHMPLAEGVASVRQMLTKLVATVRKSASVGRGGH